LCYITRRNVKMTRKGEFKMATCEVCGKKPVFGNKISHSHRVTRKMWRPNIQKVRVRLNGHSVKMNICTSCLKAGKIKKA